MLTLHFLGHSVCWRLIWRIWKKLSVSMHLREFVFCTIFELWAKTIFANWATCASHLLRILINFEEIHNKLTRARLFAFFFRRIVWNWVLFDLPLVSWQRWFFFEFSLKKIFLRLVNSNLSAVSFISCIFLLSIRSIFADIDSMVQHKHTHTHKSRSTHRFRATHRKQASLHWQPECWFRCCSALCLV